jgi:nucleoside-diphosphate-sugar epimerase
MYPCSNFPLKEDSVKLNSKLEKKYFGVGHTKLYIEKICEFFGNLGKTKYTCIRHSNIYGPNDKFDLEKGHFFASNLFKIVHAKNNKISVWGKGIEKRDLLYISDLTNFVDKTIKFQKENFRIYNCTYGKSLRVIDIIKKMVKFYNQNITIKHDLTKPSIPVNILVDSSRAKKELGWEPKVNIENGIQKTIKWLKTNI